MDGSELKRTQVKTIQKMVALIKMEKNSTQYCETIEKREYFHVKACHFQRPLKHTFGFKYIEPSIELRDVDIDYYHTHSVCSIALHMVNAIAVFTFLFCFIHFSYWAHIRQHFVCSISAMQTKNQATKWKNRNKIIFDEMISIFARFVADFSLFFFLFKISTSIYVIVIILNCIRGEILNIFFHKKPDSNHFSVVFWWFNSFYHSMIEWYTFFQWYDGECHIYMGNLVVCNQSSNMCRFGCECDDMRMTTASALIQADESLNKFTVRFVQNKWFRCVFNRHNRISNKPPLNRQLNWELKMVIN